MGELRGQHLCKRLSEGKCLAPLIFSYLHSVFLEEHNFRQEISKHLSNGAVTEPEQHSQHWRLVGSNTCHKKNNFHFDMFSVLAQYLFWKYSWLALHVILRIPKRIEKKNPYTEWSMKGNQHITSNLAELPDRQWYLGPHIYTVPVDSYMDRRLQTLLVETLPSCFLFNNWVS